MSTAGKVLVVFISLTAMGLVYLSSSVLQARKERSARLQAKRAEVGKVAQAIADLKHGTPEARQKLQELLAQYQKALREFIESEAADNFRQAVQRLNALTAEAIVEESEWERAIAAFRKATDELQLARQKLEDAWALFLGLGTEPGLRGLPSQGLGIQDTRTLIKAVQKATVAEKTHLLAQVREGDQDLARLDDLVKEVTDEAETMAQVAKQAELHRQLRTEEAQQARQQLAAEKAKLQAQTNALQQLLDKVDDLSRRFQETLNNNRQLVAQLKQSEIQYDVVHGVKSVAMTPEGRIPRGRVEQFDKRDGTIRINLGKRDGVRAGVQLHVYRYRPEPRYLGVLEVISAESDTAMARMLPPYRQLDVQAGDIVSPEIVP